MSSGSIKIIRNHDDPFAHIERAILRDNRMSLAERGFFALCLSLPTNREMTLTYFARVSGANKETVGKYFHKLEALGYLRRYQERGDHGVFGTTIYEFTTGSPCTDFPATVEPCTAEPATVEPCTANPSQKNKRKKDNIPPIIPQGDFAADGFELFWAYYRDTVCAMDHNRAGNKGKAKKAWDKLKPDRALLDRIAAYLMAQIKTDEWRRGIGIPHASSFLNAIGRGEYDLTPAETPRIAPARAPVVTEEDEIIV